MQEDKEINRGELRTWTDNEAFPKPENILAATILDPGVGFTVRARTSADTAQSLEIHPHT
jgi:hypothetical protein